MNDDDIDAEFEAIISGVLEEEADEKDTPYGVFPHPDGGVKMVLPGETVDLLAGLFDQVHQAVSSGIGPVYDRLTPPLYEEDEDNADLDVGFVVSSRNTNFETVKNSLGQEVLSRDQAIAWMKVCSDTKAALLAAWGASTYEEVSHLRQSVPLADQVFMILASVSAMTAQALNE